MTFSLPYFRHIMSCTNYQKLLIPVENLTTARLLLIFYAGNNKEYL
jgi:hypothetical protein